MELIHLQWNDIHQLRGGGLNDIWTSEELFDVTLVCNDSRQLLAHKVVLASCSTFFRKILNQNPHPHPLIYLNGVQYSYLKSILSFIYSGETKVDQKHLKEFLEIADSLLIKGLIKEHDLKGKGLKESKQEKEGEISNKEETFQLPLKTDCSDDSTDILPNPNANPAQMLNIYSFSDECPQPDIEGSFWYPLAMEGVTAQGGHAFLAHSKQKVSNIVGLTALRLAFFYGI